MEDKKTTGTDLLARVRAFSEAGMKQVAQDWALATNASFSTAEPVVKLVQRSEVAREFLARGYHTLASVEVLPATDATARGETAFLLPLPLAMTVGALMLQVPHKSIAERLAVGQPSPSDLDAMHEACNLMCGSYARGAGRQLKRDLSISQQSSRPVDLVTSSADAAQVFRWQPAAAVETRMRIADFPEHGILQLWPPDLLQRLVGAGAITAQAPPVRGTVLCISHDGAVHRAVSAALQGQGIAVLPALDVDEALAGAGEKATAVLLDVSGDFQAGLASCARLRGHVRTRDLPLLLLSDDGDRDRVVQGILAGAKDWIMLPLDPAAAVRRISKYAIR